jgi:hypothetical protein
MFWVFLKHQIVIHSLQGRFLSRPERHTVQKRQEEEAPNVIFYLNHDYSVVWFFFWVRGVWC